MLGGSRSAIAAKAATTTIPIVFTIGSDPVALGLVASLNRPGGNLTGVTSLGVELGPKRLELLHQVAPPGTGLAALVYPAGPLAQTLVEDLQAAARVLGRDLRVVHTRSERDFDAAFEGLVQTKIGGLIISADPYFVSRSQQLATLALRHRVPAIFQFREFAMAGGLMSYGGRTTDPYRLVGAYVGRILKGDKPADLPVQQVTRVELIINMKTAKALGITFPLTLLGRADEVIE